MASCSPYAVRVLLADTDETLLSKEALDAIIELVGTNTYTVAAEAARAIAAQYAGSVTKRAGDVSINASDKYKHYMDLATKLDKKAALHGLGATGAYAGGISQSDKTAREANGDRVEPYFTRELHDEPGGFRRDEKLA